MPTPSDFLTALPLTGPANKGLTRAALVKRVIYPFADNENPSDFTALVNGSVPLGLARGLVGAIFWLDPDDSSTPPDGVTVLVTADGYRYKSSNTTMPDSVKGIDQDDAPADPAYGDAYITSAAPDGEFAYNPLQIALYTQRGWVFILLRVGRPIYVEGGGGHYFLDENGDLLRTFEADGESIRDEALVGGQRRYIVQSATINDPPGSPGHGVYWIVGPSPTGDWAGSANYIATKYAGDADWTLIEPKVGDEAFVIDPDAANFIWSGTAWASAAGAWLKIAHEATPGTGSTTAPSGTTTWNFTGLPTTSHRRRIDNVGLSVQAVEGKLIRFRYSADVVVDHTITGLDREHYLGIALYRDSDSSALAVKKKGFGMVIASALYQIERSIFVEFIIEAEDSLSHDYKVAFISYPSTGPTYDNATQLSLRDFMAEVEN